MVSLLQRLWDHGINTHMSCEDNMGSTWICFDLCQFMRLHRLARSLDDLAYFVDSCHFTFSCQTPEHADWECPASDGEDYSARIPPLYHVNMRFPKRLHGTLERLLDEVRAKEDAEMTALRAERARSSDRSRSPRGPSRVDVDSEADSESDSEADSACQQAITTAAYQEMRQEVHRLLADSGGAEGDHEQVQVEAPFGVIEVDVGMVEVLRAIWALGVRTAMSCQDNKGCVWICLELAEYLRLIDLARRSPPLHRFLCLSHTFLHSTHLVLDIRFPTRYKRDFLDLLRAAGSA
jgi:hypothetical protein